MNIKKAGYWKEDGFPDMPSIHEVPRLKKKPRFLNPWVAFYLINSPLIVLSMSGQPSILDPSRNISDALRTDGKYVWEDSIIHYYFEHGIPLDKEFERHIKRRLFPFPIWFFIRNLLSNGKLKKQIWEALIEEVRQLRAGIDDFVHPISQNEYSIEGGYRFLPFNESAPTQATDLEVIVLPFEENQVDISILSREVENLVEPIQALFLEHFLEAQGSGRVLVQVQLWEDEKATVECGFQQEIEEGRMLAFEEAVKALSLSFPKQYSYTFQLVFKVNQPIEQ